MHHRHLDPARNRSSRCSRPECRLRQELQRVDCRLASAPAAFIEGPACSTPLTVKGCCLSADPDSSVPVGNLGGAGCQRVGDGRELGERGAQVVNNLLRDYLRRYPVVGVGQ